MSLRLIDDKKKKAMVRKCVVCFVCVEILDFAGRGRDEGRIGPGR